MKLTALIENRAPEGLAWEHGLSIWIEYNDKVILLDSGASNAFLGNADALGLDLARVDAAVLSHGHFDHSGGYAGLFARNSRVSVAMRGGADGPNYAGHPLRGMEYIGIPKDILAQYPRRFSPLQGNAELLPGVWALPDGVAGLEDRSRRAGMYRKAGDTFVPEPFRHEQTLVLEGASGLVVLNSCSHAGVPGILRTVMRAFPGRPIAAFFGGFHMMGRTGVSSLGWSEAEVRAEAEALKALPVSAYYTCHCTGTPAFALLKEVLEDRISYFQTGDQVEIP